MYCAWRLDALRPLNYTEAVSEHKDSLFRQALDHYRARRLAEASGLYHEILQATPNHTDVLYLLGVLAHQTGQPAQAVELICRALAALAIRPANSPDDLLALRRNIRSLARTALPSSNPNKPPGNGLP
jgi:tetratricopeptide (TPR) repeat protein